MDPPGQPEFGWLRPIRYFLQYGKPALHRRTIELYGNISPMTANSDDQQEQLEKIAACLTEIGAENSAGLYTSIIASQAIKSAGIFQMAGLDRTSLNRVHGELKSFARSLSRSKLSNDKIETKISGFSEEAAGLFKAQFALVNNQAFLPNHLDWQDEVVRNGAIAAAKKALRWCSESPGPKTRHDLRDYCSEVMAVYRAVAKKDPGLGAVLTTPFERLWHASILLVEPNTTMVGAREIFRKASLRR